MFILHVDRSPVIFTGGTHKTQSIKVWDPRAKKLVYELATGNNAVHSLAWDAPRATLYAATECDAMDRMGYISLLTNLWSSLAKAGPGLTSAQDRHSQFHVRKTTSRDHLVEARPRQDHHCATRKSQARQVCIH